MQRYIAFLRAINVSGHNIIKMEDLRKLWALPGIGNVKTYIQSGNVVLDATHEVAKLLKHLSKPLKEHTGNDIEIMLRTVDELKAVVKTNPFKTIPSDHTLYITFLNEVPAKDAAKQLEGKSNEVDQFKIKGREVYALVDKRAPKSQFSNMFVEKQLKLPATGRNMNTVEKMLALAEA
ncbi:MAG: DUF1697 domain-containing protein [Sphingobacteriales bacterium]|nr:MAG: DUF1697 domain-containing protein [Sphingobacteriales bacterium]